MSKQKQTAEVDEELRAAFHSIKKRYGVLNDVPDSIVGPLQMIYILETGVSRSKNRRGVKKAAARLFEIGRLLGAGLPLNEASKGVDAIFENFGEAFSDPENNSAYQLWSEAFSIAEKFNALPQGWIPFQAPPKQTGVIRMGKGLNDNIIKRQGDRKPTLFDHLDNEWQAAISKANGGDEITTGSFLEGIELEPEENAFMDSLFVILHRESVNTVERKEDSYYKGSQIKTNSGRTFFRVSFTELAKIYNGGVKPSQDELNRLKEVTERLAAKRYKVTYVVEASPHGKKTTKRIEKAYAPLFEIREVTIEVGNKRATKYEIVLHELLRADIASRYIELPEDIRTRTRQAFGKASHTDYALRAYLLNEVSSKRKESIINRETAYERFTIKGTRPARQRELLDKALEKCKRLGLLESYEETTGQGGQLKLILNSDLDWSRKPFALLGEG